jgi:spore coat polysaccharide biosynthesis protein SpsF (cytidylyltransferase family)
MALGARLVKTCVFIQARDGSTRFPGKIRQEIGGISVIDRVERAARRIDGVDEVRVLYPFSHRDENDVLGRFMDAALNTGADIIMRLTGDCPFFDPQVGSLVLSHYMVQPSPNAYVSNVWPRRTWPDGLDCEVFSTSLLMRAAAQAVDPYDREHVTPWMQRNALVVNVTLPVDWSHVRLTVDTPEDLAWLRTAWTSPRSGSPS